MRALISGVIFALGAVVLYTTVVFSAELVPGTIMQTGFLCHTPEGAMRMGVAADTLEKAAAIEVAQELLRGGECINLYPFTPEVVFVEPGEIREHTQVWRAKWGNEEWFVPVDWHGKES